MEEEDGAVGVQLHVGDEEDHSLFKGKPSFSSFLKPRFFFLTCQLFVLKKKTHHIFFFLFSFFLFLFFSS